MNRVTGHEVGPCVGQCNSSLPSKQSLCLSQRQRLGIHCPLAQVKADEEQVLSKLKKKKKEDTYKRSPKFIFRSRILDIFSMFT